MVAAQEMVKDSLGRMVEKPQYGGVLNLVVDQPDGSFDPNTYYGAFFAMPVYEHLSAADWSRGPSGTGEFPMYSTYEPLEGRVGFVAESWEQPDLHTVIYHIRKGVHFQDKPPVNGREVTAHDVVYSFLRSQDHPKSEWYKPKGTPEKELYKATALDKWTVEFKMPEASVFKIMDFGSEIRIAPREVADKHGYLEGFEDWRNAVGSGAFMVQDFAPGSSVTYVRNPDYHRFDPLHPENRLPYVDVFKLLILTDPATRLAALRTGKVDQMSRILLEDAKKLQETNPELKWRKLPPRGGFIFAMNENMEPAFRDVRVRQAATLAVNQPEMVKHLYGGEAEILNWPLPSSSPKEIYTPFEELPPDIKELFGFHPEKSKQLLAEAGYPDGLKTHILHITPDSPLGRESIVAPLVASYLEQGGFKVEIEAMELTPMLKLYSTATFPGMNFVSGWTNGNPMWPFMYAHRTGHPWNDGRYSNSEVDRKWDEISVTLDIEKRNKMWKELNLFLLKECPWLVLPSPNQYVFWQPWVKGYSGEFKLGDTWNLYSIAQHMWLDLDLKNK